MPGRFRLLSAFRRRLRLGIGGMMLFILLLGLWLGDRVNRARAQRHAVEAVKADGGWVHYADEFKMGAVNVPAGNALWQPGWGTLTPGKGPWAPAWLRRALGDEFLREVAHVSLFVDIGKGGMTAPNDLPRPVDDVLADLRGQSGIKTLHLGGATVTDKGLASVAELTDLRELAIWWATKISDAGVAHLGRLPRLRMVDISNSSLTDEGVKHLASLPALEELSIEGKSFTDQSLLDLSRSSRLKSLTLRGDTSAITDKGLAPLGKLKGLKRLYLQNSKISAEAREALIKAIPGLEFVP